MPGSNWHTYLFDPDGHSNELYYGIEQIGWNGHSKPRIMYDRGFDHPPELPQISEQQEVQDALTKNVDLLSGYRSVENLPAIFDVDGISLPRPFKIVRLGPSIFLLKTPQLLNRSTVTRWALPYPRRSSSKATAAFSFVATRSITRWRSCRWRSGMCSVSAPTPNVPRSACKSLTTASFAMP
jgi:hypothetical protein